MNLSRDEFYSKIHAISKDVSHFINNRIIYTKTSLPELIKETSLLCFVTKVKECNGTDLLREYMRELSSKGYVEFN